jgi:hypothetical protein
VPVQYPIAAALLAVSLTATTHVSAPALQGPDPTAAACAAAQHRQFDFWLGEWQVHTPKGKFAGRNTITRTLGGCVLEERWRGAGGHNGTSVNIYDASRKRWHQTWVDDDGMLLQLDGGIVEHQMVLSGETLAATGVRIAHRVTWTPMGHGKVRQRWQSSKDHGATWETAFEGIYSPMRP